MNQKGFTAIELLAVVAVLTVLAAIAIPQFNNTIANRDLDSATRLLVSDLRNISEAAGHSADPTKSSLVLRANGYTITIANISLDANGAKKVTSTTRDVVFPNTVQATTTNTIVFKFANTPWPPPQKLLTLQSTRTGRTNNIQLYEALGTVLFPPMNPTN